MSDRKQALQDLRDKVAADERDYKELHETWLMTMMDPPPRPAPKGDTP